ncbi:MAG: hypothetical protein QXZ02_01050 [Candidatus Bathyarchaeia archaeon]
MFLAKEKKYSAETFMLKPNNKLMTEMICVMKENWFFIYGDYASKFDANYVDVRLEIH